MGVTAADQAEDPAAAGGSGGEATARLRLPGRAEPTHEAAREALRATRSFFLGAGEPALEGPGDGELPALMHRFRDPGAVRSEFPLLLLPPGEARAAVPLAAWLRETADELAETLGDVRLVRDAMPRLELAARQRVGGRSRPIPAGEVIAGLAASVEAGERARDRLGGDLRTLAAAAPEGSVCVGLDEHTAVRLAMHAAWRRWSSRRAALVERARTLREGLGRLLEEEARRRGGAAPERVAEALGGPGAGIDPAELARAIGTRRGPIAMPAARWTRIERAVETLGTLGDAGPGAVVVHGGELDGLEGTPAGIELERSARPCARAAEALDRLADDLAPVALAMRVAELELAGSFDPAVFGPMVESFDRGSLSGEEVGELPAVIAVETPERLVGTDMPNVTRALLAGRPIRVIVQAAPAASLLPSSGDDPLAGYRFEPGLFGLGLRQARTHQSAASRPEHLLAGLERSLESPRASLHVVATGRCADGSAPGVGAWLHIGAALEGRAHAFFSFDPDAGPAWADRMDFSGNEQPEADWPTHELECLDGGGAPHTITVAFTFADFALLEPSLRGHFGVVPEACPTNDLTPVDQYPAEGAPPGDRRIPFVWSADADGRMRRLVVTRRLLEASRDRLSAWRTLRELAGVRNAYVERAVAGERAALRGEAEARMGELSREHASELEAARREAAGEAMARLAERLLEVDPSGAAPLPRPSAPAAPPADEPAPPVDAEAPAPEPAADGGDDDAGFDDPYIDSVLCTSCNDCLAINPQMFVYNENKQALIGDPDAGTFAQLVQAAEKCPARCIHPGKPRNPDEANLEALVERARPFN